MEKKNKKKLFAIIGGSVLAFVLTIALSVSITLAYFGGTSNGNSTISLGVGVTVGSTSVTSENLTGLLPGQKVTFSASTTVQAVDNDEDTTSTGTAYLFAILEVEGAEALETAFDALVDKTNWTQAGTSTRTIANGEGAEDDETVTGIVYMLNAKIENVPEAGVAKSLTIADSKLEIPTSLDNDDALAELGVSVRFVATQEAIDTDGSIKANPQYSDFVTIINWILNANSTNTVVA